MAKLPWWLNLFVKVLFVDLAITLFVAVWSWITKDSSLVSLSNRFFVGGAIAVLISLASGMGNWENRSDWRQMFAQSAGQANLTERNQRMMADIVQVYSLTFVMIPAGLIAILIAVLLGQLA
ncbi:MAG TPA: hypothetical protein VF918_15425 [Anaerolineales bacterium]